MRAAALSFSLRPDIYSYIMNNNSSGIMQNNKKFLLLGSLAAVLFLAAAVAVFTVSTPDASVPEQGNAEAPRKASKANARKRRPTKTLAQRIQEKAEKEKPQLLSDLDDEAKLTAEERALLEELQEGLDANSLRRVAKTVEKIRKLIREKGEQGVPKLLRSECVEALGWFLPDSLADLIPFMADSDPDVLDDVMTQFESAIDDSSLGDRELSNILKTVARVLDNEDALDALFMGIESDMRNSVAVATYLEILKTGSPAAKARIWESIEDFTGEDNIKSEADLIKWASDPENADDEDDDDFYGPDRDSDDEGN